LKLTLKFLFYFFENTFLFIWNLLENQLMITGRYLLYIYWIFIELLFVEKELLSFYYSFIFSFPLFSIFFLYHFYLRGDPWGDVRNSFISTFGQLFMRFKELFKGEICMSYFGNYFQKCFVKIFHVSSLLSYLSFCCIRVMHRLSCTACHARPVRSSLVLCVLSLHLWILW
jgi:hypothetical protein